ncbi:MAG TPA: hypothetical protein VF746_00955 [Longimicrobium sp.]|jgi:hypothetical protein
MSRDDRFVEFLRAAAARYRDGTEPPADEIWSRLAPEVGAALGGRRRGLRWRGSLRRAAWAASLAASLALGFALHAWLARPAARDGAAARAQAAPAAWEPTAEYRASVARLERVVAEGRGTLRPETLRTIERSLATVDAAIRQAEAALRSDPANASLGPYLAELRLHKLTALRQAAGAVRRES